MRIRNPSNIQRGCDGVLRDKYGRTFKVDWKEFDKLRNKRTVPLMSAIKLK